MYNLSIFLLVTSTHSSGVRLGVRGERTLCVRRVGGGTEAVGSNSLITPVRPDRAAGSWQLEGEPATVQTQTPLRLMACATLLVMSMVSGSSNWLPCSSV